MATIAVLLTALVLFSVVVGTVAITFAPCNLELCNIDTDCSASGRICVSGGCVDPSSIKLQKLTGFAATPADVFVLFRATDKHGAPLTHFALPNVTCEEDGEPMSPQAAFYALLPHAPSTSSGEKAGVFATYVHLLVDQGASMQARAPVVKDALLEMLYELLLPVSSFSFESTSDKPTAAAPTSTQYPPPTFVKLSAFGGDAHLYTLANFTQDLATLTEAVVNLTLPVGMDPSCDMYSALVHGYESFETISTNASVITPVLVLVTDRKDSAHRLPASAALTAATQSPALTFAIGIGDAAPVEFLTSIATAGYFPCKHGSTLSVFPSRRTRVLSNIGQTSDSNAPKPTPLLRQDLVGMEGRDTWQIDSRRNKRDSARDSDSASASSKLVGNGDKEFSFRDALISVARRIPLIAGSTYVLAYCTPSRGGVHTLGMTLGGGVTEDSLTVTFDAKHFGAGCEMVETQRCAQCKSRFAVVPVGDRKFDCSAHPEPGPPSKPLERGFETGAIVAMVVGASAVAALIFGLARYWRRNQGVLYTPVDMSL